MSEEIQIRLLDIVEFPKPGTLEEALMTGGLTLSYECTREELAAKYPDRAREILINQNAATGMSLEDGKWAVIEGEPEVITMPRVALADKLCDAIEVARQMMLPDQFEAMIREIAEKMIESCK